MFHSLQCLETVITELDVITIHFADFKLTKEEFLEESLLLVSHGYMEVLPFAILSIRVMINESENGREGNTSH